MSDEKVDRVMEENRENGEYDYRKERTMKKEDRL
jgi:hypothetical protein